MPTQPAGGRTECSRSGSGRCRVGGQPAADWLAATLDRLRGVVRAARGVPLRVKPKVRLVVEVLDGRAAAGEVLGLSGTAFAYAGLGWANWAGLFPDTAPVPGAGTAGPAARSTRGSPATAGPTGAGIGPPAGSPVPGGTGAGTGPGATPTAAGG